MTYLSETRRINDHIQRNYVPVFGSDPIFDDFVYAVPVYLHVRAAEGFEIRCIEDDTSASGGLKNCRVRALVGDIESTGRRTEIRDEPLVVFFWCCRFDVFDQFL